LVNAGTLPYFSKKPLRTLISQCDPKEKQFQDLGLHKNLFMGAKKDFCLYINLKLFDPIKNNTYKKILTPSSKIIF
jgi:hypothetical protein